MDKMYLASGVESDDDDLEYMMNKLKIKRLEDITIGACINGDFDAKLDKDFQLYFNVFRDKWNMHNKHKSSPYMRHELTKTLMRHTDPMLLALKIFANCPDSSNIKNKSLSHFILETACKMQTDFPHLNETCDDNISMIAFHFVKTSGMPSFNNAMILSYRIKQIKELLVPKLRNMLNDGYYKEVAQWTISLQLTHNFDMLELVFPLIVQEKLPLAEEYLDHAILQRLPLVQFLDSLLHKDKSVIELCENILDGYKNLKVSYNVLCYRPISKIVARLAKKYGYDDALTPNFKFTKTCNYLHFLCREYEKTRINKESFRELVHVHAYDYPLKVDFVNYLAKANSHAGNELEVLYWYQEFRLLPEDCSLDLNALISFTKGQQEDQQLEQQQSVQPIDVDDPKETTATSETYLSMDLPDECLIIVDKPGIFERMLEHLQSEHIIYFDSEWMQNIFVQNQLCVIQVATKENVYLIDCLALQEEHWQVLGANVFNNVNILKVGFSLSNDLAVLQRSLPLNLRLNMPNHYLDLRNVWLELKKQRHGFELPYGNVNRAGEALTDLTLLCLGKKLDKTNQCSNWANRPLRRDQILYAATDARCLFHIYNCLNKCVANFSAIIDRSIATNNFMKRGTWVK